MATTDQPALSAFHEIEGDTYRLTFASDLAAHGKPLTTTVLMSVGVAEQLADAIYDTINQSGARR